MSDLTSSTKPKRPEFRNINALTDLPTYRLPAAGWVSILHRISGAIMFLLMPFIIWMFDKSVSSEYSYAKFTSAFNIGLGFVPGVLIKLVVLALIWAYLHHFIAGVRHLWMDINHAVSKEFGKSSAVVTLALSLGLTAILGAKLFGLYYSIHLTKKGTTTMAVNYGSKRSVVGAHYGLRDWLAQRVTAVLMALFTLLVLGQVILTKGPIGYEQWAGIFAAQWMKALTFAVIVAMLYHVWVGVRDIFMDYIKPLAVRLSLQVFSIVWLVACAGWAIQVLWRL